MTSAESGPVDAWIEHAHPPSVDGQSGLDAVLTLFLLRMFIICILFGHLATTSINARTSFRQSRRYCTGRRDGEIFPRCDLFV